MQFPLGLTAKLMMTGLQRALGGKRENTPVFVLDIAPTANELSESTAVSFAAKSKQQIMDVVQNCSAPVVWIGGSEPLHHPQVGRLTSVITSYSPYLFVETDGAMLRRRIHEFQPGPRLFFSVKLDGLEQSHDNRAGRASAFRLAMEGIRAARLSGFLICARTKIFPDTNLEELSRLGTLLQTSGVDGWVITASAETEDDSSNRNAMRQKVKEARLLIANRRWERFSELVETAQNVPMTATTANEKTPTVETVTEECEESVQAQ